MTIARLAYLTSPAPDRFILHIQKYGSNETEQIEISKGHLANILIDGSHYALREFHHRVPETRKTESANERRT